jgi:hypothetical protein
MRQLKMGEWREAKGKSVGISRIFHFLSPLASCPLPGIVMERDLRDGFAMAVLKKQAIERYLRGRFGPKATLLTYGVIGKDSSQGTYKQYGYGTPVKLTFQVGRKIQSAVLETMKPGPFGHEHMADRAQAMLWDYDSYGRLPRHVKALDIGAFTADHELMSVAPAREFFVLNQWTDGSSYHFDLERLIKGGRLRKQDRPGALPGRDSCQKTSRSRPLSASASGVDRPWRMYYGTDRQLSRPLRVHHDGSLARG